MVVDKLKELKVLYVRVNEGMKYVDRHDISPQQQKKGITLLRSLMLELTTQGNLINVDWNEVCGIKEPEVYEQQTILGGN